MVISEKEVMENLKYLELLAKQYPTIQKASTEIINLQAILDLPKGTEHFLSDIHGEYEAFTHILNNASGVIKEKVDMLYQNSVPAAERASLATLIYYPKQKLQEVKRNTADMNEWYRITLHRLIDICRLVSSKYTRSKVRKALPEDFEYIIDELLHTNYETNNKDLYYEKIISTIIDIDRADAFISALSGLIKRLVVDRLHMVGDIFDRGPRADIVMDKLLSHHSVDIQWGNHDILWMGAAAGNGACIANVLNLSMQYNNLEVIELGYGISLRPLAVFAQEVYQDNYMRFWPRTLQEARYNPKDLQLVAQMHKAIAIIQLKLEGQIILRHPEYNMNDRLMLNFIDYEAGTVVIDGSTYNLTDCSFPTIDPNDPYRLSEEERVLVEQLTAAFARSEKLQKHVRFLYSNGSLYKCFNSNLLFHGCIPMEPDGTFMEFEFEGEKRKGKAFMDYADALARQGYYAPACSQDKRYGEDFLWFLWCGRNSPLFGRTKMTTFERLLIEEESTWIEPKNAYYQFTDNEEACIRILLEFGLDGAHSHIINGHVPVHSKDGESPIKANGRLIVIDGGFCRAYQPKTGIAGYTLIYNSYGTRISSHQPFAGSANAIRENSDIFSVTKVFETVTSRIKVSQTDSGQIIQKNIQELKLLLAAYRMGVIKETESFHPAKA